MNILVERRASRLLGLCLGFVVISSVVVASDQDKLCDTRVAALSLSVTPPPRGGAHGFSSDAAGGSPIASGKCTKKARSGSVSSGGSRGEKRGIESLMDMPRSVSPCGCEINMSFYPDICARALISDVLITKYAGSEYYSKALEQLAASGVPGMDLVLERACKGDTTVPGISELEQSIAADELLTFDDRVSLLVLGNMIFSAYLVALAADVSYDHPLARVVGHLAEVGASVGSLAEAPKIPAVLSDTLQLAASSVLAKYQSALAAMSGKDPHVFVADFIKRVLAISAPGERDAIIRQASSRSGDGLNPYQKNTYGLIVLYRGCRLGEIYQKFNEMHGILVGAGIFGSDAEQKAAVAVVEKLPDNSFL